MADERLDEMASTMKAAAIAEMKAELEATGYIAAVEHDGDLDTRPAYYLNAYAATPDGVWEYRGKSQHVKADKDSYSILHAQCEKDAIEKAYAHLEKERQHAALLELVKMALKYDTPEELEGEEDVVVTTHLWNWFFGEFVAEAKRILKGE